MRILPAYFIAIGLCSSLLFGSELDLTTTASVVTGKRNKGSWSLTIPHDPASISTLTGSVRTDLYPGYRIDTYRSHLSFDLSSVRGRVLSATLRMTRFAALANGSNTSGLQTLGVFDVTTDAATLNTTSGINSTIYGDLGTGTSYGTFNFPVELSADDVIEMPLNADALAAINSGDRYFSVGLTLLSDPGTGAESNYMFGNTGGPYTGTQSLHLVIADDPNPPSNLPPDVPMIETPGALEGYDLSPTVPVDGYGLFKFAGHLGKLVVGADPVRIGRIGVMGQVLATTRLSWVVFADEDFSNPVFQSASVSLPSPTARQWFDSPDFSALLLANKIYWIGFVADYPPQSFRYFFNTSHLATAVSQNGLTIPGDPAQSAYSRMPFINPTLAAITSPGGGVQFGFRVYPAAPPATPTPTPTPAPSPTPNPTPTPGPSDKKKPVIEVYGGTTRITRGASILLGGRVTDNVRVASLEIKKSGGRYKDVPQSGYWSVTLKLSSGKNVFTLRATDTSGNTAQQRIVVTQL